MVEKVREVPALPPGRSDMPTVTQPVQGSPVSVLPLLMMGCFVLCQVGRAEVRDAGRYTCEALNEAGRSEKHFNLNVWGEGLLGWFGVPLPAPPRTGRHAPRECCLDGTPGHSPPPPLSLPLPANHPLHTPFSYSVPPVFPPREPRTLTVMEGHPARLSCECRGVPFPKISWRKDGKRRLREVPLL